MYNQANVMHEISRAKTYTYCFTRGKNRGFMGLIMGIGSGEGHLSPFQVWGSEGFAQENFLNTIFKSVDVFILTAMKNLVLADD